FMGPFGTGTRDQGLILWNFVPHPKIEKSYVSDVHEHEVDLEVAQMIAAEYEYLLDEMMDFGEFTCSILFSVKKIEVLYSMIIQLNIIFSIWPIQQQIVEGDLLSGCIEANFESITSVFLNYRDCHLCNLFMIFGT
ncbi:hypothetical protein ACJX0J_016790, partial [Zea mays]